MNVNVTFMEFIRKVRMSERSWQALKEWRDANPDRVTITENTIEFDSDDSIIECAEYMRKVGAL